MFRIGKEEAEAVARIIETKQLFFVNEGTQECKNFEKEWAEKIGTEYAILLTSGTGALMAALVGLGVGPGDEVIVPGHTFMASASAVLAIGAIPVLAEIDETMTIDPKDIEKKITKNTKCIIPVHICGYPCDMDAIMEIAKKHNLFVLEDACQADGGSYKGRRLGSIGNAGAFSFNYWKLITAGEGGAVVTSDRKVYERAAIFHDSGCAFRPYAGEFSEPFFMGTQMRSNEVSGAILRVQLKRMDGIIADLKKVKAKLSAAVAQMEKISEIPSHDIEGDLGSTFGIRFETEEAAAKFDELSKDTGLDGCLVANSGKHVYYRWDPIMKHLGAHCDAMNPYNLPQNQGLQMEYSHDMLPQTLDLLNRTYHINLHCDWTEEEIQTKVDDIRKVCAQL